jgi:uncharacterized membrane protein
MGTLFTGTLSFAMTGSTKTALLIGTAEITFKVLLFWAHERLWARIRWGRHPQAAPGESEVGWSQTASVTTPARAGAPGPELFAPSAGASALSLHASPHPVYAPREG